MICLSTTKDYKVGDLPPSDSAGYSEWFAWAEVQRQGGVRQQPCSRCSKWKTPQELSDKRDSFEASKTKRGAMRTFQTDLICLECVAKLEGK